MQTSFFKRYGPWIIGVALLSAPLCVWATAKVFASNANTIEGWLPDGDPTAQEFQWFQQQFTLKETVLVSWDGCTLKDERLPRFAQAIRRRGEKLPAGQRWFDEVTTGPEALRQLAAPPFRLPPSQALEHSRGGFVGSDRSTTCALLTLTPQAARRREAVVDFLIAAAEQADVPPEQVHLAGSTIQVAVANQETARLFYHHSSVAALISVALAYVCLRSVRLVAMLFAVASLSTGYGMVIFYATGGTMNALLTLLPALWFVLSISGGMHLIHYYQHALHEVPPAQAAIQALAQGWLPCLLATVTTAIGLGSLMISSLTPIWQFGAYSVVGLLFTVSTQFLLLPALLQFASPPGRRTPQRQQAGDPRRAWRGFWRWLDDWRRRWQTVILGAAIALMMLGALGVARLDVSFRLKNSYAEDTRIIRDYTWIEENIGPMESVEVILQFGPQTPESFFQRLERVRELERAISANVPGTEVTSAATLTPELPKGGGLWQNARRALWKRRILENHREYVRAGYLAEQPNHEFWRITVRIPATGEVEESVWLREIRNTTEASLDRWRVAGQGPIDARYTGPAVLVGETCDRVWAVLLKSFLLAFALIAVVMVFALRSLGAGLVSMVPNVLPAVVSFGLMGWLRIPLEGGSLMTASVAMGIAVDDTFHFLVSFSRARGEAQNRADAVLTAYHRAGPAMMQTSLNLGCALLVFLRSDFVPAACFGGLMFIMLFSALLGDLIFLPALLLTPLGKLFRPSQMTKAPSNATEAGD